MIYCDGLFIYYLSIPPAIQNEVTLIEHLLTLNNHIPARITNQKDKSKLKLMMLNSEDSSTQSENFQEKEFASVRRISHLSNVTTSINDLLTSFGLLASTCIPWDEKMELMSVDTVGKLYKILEDLFIYSVDVDRNWKFPVGIIDSIILKCFNMLRFDVRHNLMATALKFLMTVIDLLISNVKTIKGKQRMPYLNCIYEIMVNSEQLVSDIYSWTWRNDARTPFSYQSSQLITMSSEYSRELDYCFQHRLKMKWKEFYKILLQCLSKFQTKQAEVDEKTCKELLCKLQLKLQISGCVFKKRKKKYVTKGKNLSEKASKKLEEILHCILHGLLITNDLVTVFTLIQKLVKFLQFDSSCKHISAINCLLLTFAHLLASYFTNNSPKIAKCSRFILKSTENSDIFQLISRENIHSAVTTNNLSDFWSAETACALYIFIGAFAEAAIFADAMGDWKSTFLMSVVHSKMGVSAKKYLDVPNNLTIGELMAKMLKQIIEAENKVVDTAQSRTITKTLQDHITASILCDINVVPILLNHFMDQLKCLLRQLPLAVPEEFYLPSPPIFCPQDEMALSTSDAKIETKIRNELSNLIHSFINLLTASKMLLPAAYKYAKDLQCLELIHPFADYLPIVIPDHDDTFDQMQICFQDICSVIWLLHSRDKFQIEWRNFWRISSEIKFCQQKCDSYCLAALICAKCIKPFASFMQWKLDFYQVVLTLAREATASTKIVDVFAGMLPDITELPLECELRVKLLLKDWEANKVGKNSPKSLVDYYRDSCQNCGIIEETITTSELGIHSKLFESDEDFQSCLCLFYDVAIHKRMEETANSKHNFPLVVSYAKEVKEMEFSKYRYIPEAFEAKKIVQRRDLVKLDIRKSRNSRKGFFQSSSLLDLTQNNNTRIVPKRSRSLEIFKNKDGKLQSNSHKKSHSNDIPVQSIINELQSISLQRKVEASDKMHYLDHLVLWLDKWKRRNHTFKTINCDKEIQPQIHIEISVEQILASRSRLELCSKKPQKQNKKTLMQVRKPPNKIENLFVECNGTSEEKKNEENLNSFDNDLFNIHYDVHSANVVLPNSEKFEDTHIHPTGLDLPNQSQTVSDMCLVKHSTKAEQTKPKPKTKPKPISVNGTFDIIANNESTSSFFDKDDDTLDDVSFPNSIPDPPTRTVHFREPPPLPKPCIPKFLRLVAEKENFQTKSIDPRLRGGGCFGQMQFPLLSAPAAQNFNSNAPSCLSTWGLPLLRLPQKYLTNPVRQPSPPCHVCVDVNPCNQNLYVQNMLRSYWTNVKQKRCQQMVDYSLNRNPVCHQTPAEAEPQNVDQMRLLNGNYSSSDVHVRRKNVHRKYDKPGTSNRAKETEDTSDTNMYFDDRYRQLLQSDSSCYQVIHTRNVCSPTYINEKYPQPKMLSRATSPIRTAHTKMVTRTTSPTKMVTRTTSPTKMVTKTTSPMKMVTKTTSPVEMVTRTTSPVEIVTRTTLPYKMLNKTTSPIKTCVVGRTSSPQYSPQRTSTPPLSPRSVCSPPLRRGSTPPLSPRRRATPPLSTRRVSSPPFSSRRTSAICKSKSLSSSKMKSRYYSPPKSRSRSPSPTRQQHLIHSCTSSVYPLSNEDIGTLPQSPKTSFSCLSPSIERNSNLNHTTKTIETQVDSDIFPSSFSKAYTLPSDSIKHSLLDVVNEFAETHHHVINQLEEVRELMKEMNRQDKDRVIQIDQNVPLPETNQQVISQLQEVHDLMKEMYQHDKNKAIHTIQDSPPSDTSSHVSRLQEVNKFMEKTRQQLQTPTEKSKCLDVTKTSLNRNPPRQLPQIPSPPNSAPSSCPSSLYGKKFTAPKQHCLPIKKQPIPGLEGCDGAGKSPSSERKCKTRKQTNPNHNFSPHMSCVPKDPSSPYLYGKIPSKSPKRILQTDSNRRKIEKCPSPVSVTPPGPTITKYYNYVGEKTSDCLSPRPWALKSTANPRSLKIQNVSNPIIVQDSTNCSHPVSEDYYHATKTLSPTHYGKTSASTKQTMHTRPLITSPCLAYLQCASPITCPHQPTLPECVKRQKILARPKSSRINPFLIEKIVELPMDEDKENAGQVLEKNWHSTSSIPKSKDAKPYECYGVQRNLKSWSTNLTKIVERETSGADEGHIDSPKPNAVLPENNFNGHELENFDSGIDVDKEKNSILDFQIPDIAETMYEMDEIVMINEVLENDQILDCEVGDFEVIDVSQTPQVKARDSLQLKLKSIKEQCDLMDTISNELQIDFEDSKQLLNSVNKLANYTTMLQPTPVHSHARNHQIYRSPRLTLNLNPKAQLVVHIPKSKPNSSGTESNSNCHLRGFSPIHGCQDRNLLSTRSCQGKNFSPTRSYQGKHHSPIFSCPIKSLSPLPNCQSKCFVPFLTSPSKVFEPIHPCQSKRFSPTQTATCSSSTIEHFPSATTSKNVASVQGSVHSKECQQNMHFKMRMQDACELMKELLSPDTNRPGGSNDQLAPTDSGKPKEMKQILTKMEETLKKDLSKMGIYKAPYLQANSWTTNSNDSIQGRFKDEATNSQSGQLESEMSKSKHQSETSKSKRQSEPSQSKHQTRNYASQPGSRRASVMSSIQRWDHVPSRYKLPLINESKSHLADESKQKIKRRSVVSKSNLDRIPTIEFIPDVQFIRPLRQKERVKTVYQPPDVKVRMNRTQLLRKKLTLTKLKNKKKKQKLISDSHVCKHSGSNKSNLQEYQQADDALLQSESEIFEPSSTSSPSTWTVPQDVKKIIYDDEKSEAGDDLIDY
uniref:Uncharacterized protein n=1 Tax=Strigamia maritima TaxID=126957 RepID=T1J753_STRMM